MRILPISLLFLTVCGFPFMSEASSVPVRDMYRRAKDRTRQGSEIRQIESAARFVRQSMDSSSSKDLACSIRKALPEGRGGQFLEQVAGILAGINQESLMDSLTSLTRSGYCDPPMIAKAAPKPLTVIHLDTLGAVVSENPVWNACVRGSGITSALIKSNQDRSLQRTGRQRTWIPWSCRDYHKGPVDVWTHPDHPELSMVLDEHGKLVSALPVGYLAVKSAKQSPRVAGGTTP